MPDQILINTNLDTQLLEQGFVVVQFLNDAEIKNLTDFFYETHPAVIDGFYATAHVSDIPFRKKMSERIKMIFQRSINNYFYKCKALGGSFVVKSNLQKQRLEPHQDWNIVDEEKYRSFNIWVPLVDLTNENGVIKVLPRSHRWIKTFRGPNLPDVFDNVHQEIWKSMQSLYMKAGDALIYDHRLFHASEPNITPIPRLAAVFGIISNKAQMYYYCGNNGNIEMYESSPEFFLNEDIQKGPEILKKVSSTKMVNRKISKWYYYWLKLMT
jgi:hypothetical protein